MKTRHIFTIVFLFVLVFLPLNTVFGQNVTVPNDLDSGDIFQMSAKDTALPGDLIQINGTLITKDPIKIVLSNPVGTIQSTATTFADRDGYFTATLKMPNDVMNGTWKIIGTSGNYQRVLPVDVSVFVSTTSYCCLISNSSTPEMDYLPGTSSDFFIEGHVIPNATVPIGFDIINEGNFTLYDAHIQIMNSAFLQNFQTSYGNFTLRVGQEKTITGIASLPSEISHMPSDLRWKLYATDQNGIIRSKEFTRSINLTNISIPEYSTSNTAILPPLRQSGPVNYVVCKEGLQLIIKSENYVAACVTHSTEQKLIIRGWGETLEGLMEPPTIKKMEIIGLEKNYKIGQQIHATIKYIGWGYSNVPDMKILDSNGTQVWFNCPECVTHTEMAIQYPGIFTTFTYSVSDVNGNYPSINKTGSYTLVTSLGNEPAKFDVIP